VGHPRAQTRELRLEPPTECEGVLSAQVVHDPLDSIDIYLVVGLHDIGELLEQGLRGDDAHLPADHVAAALNLDQADEGVAVQPELLAVVRCVEVAEFGIPLGQRLPLHVGVVEGIAGRVVA